MKWDDIVYNHTLSTGFGGDRYIDVAYGKDGKLFAIHDSGRYLYIREVTNYGYGENLAWLGPIDIVDSDGHNHCSSIYNQFSMISSGDAICVVWRDLRYWYYQGAYYTPSVVYDCSFTNSIYGFGKDVVINRDFYYPKSISKASAAIYNNNLYTVWINSSKVKMNILPLLPKASSYNEVNISAMSDLSGRPIKLPDFNVTDMAFSDPLLVMIGKNNVLAINTSNNTVLLNVTDTESTFNSVIVNGSFAIVVGNKTSSAIWTCNLSEAMPTLTEVTAAGENSWIEDYGTFSDINYAYGEDCFIVAGMTEAASYICVVKYSENPLEWRASQTSSLEGKITTLCNVDKNEDAKYLIFTWDGTDNYYYTCDGELNGEGYPNLLSEVVIGITLPSKINASVGAPIAIDTKYWVYLALGNYIYRMSLDSNLQNPNVKTIDIDGDANSSYFNYTALDYVYDENGLDKVVIVGEVLLGIAGQTKYIRGVWAILSNVDDSNEANIVTDVFKVTDHTKPFKAVAVKDNGTIYLGGSYQIISSDYYGYEALNIDVDNVLPIAKDFKIDYASVSYSEAKTHAQLEPTGGNAIAVWIDVLDGNGREEITEVTLQAWHDGEDGSITWPDSPTDANGVVNITYNVATNRFTLNYPTTGEVSLGLGSASIVDDCTLRIKFVFVPGKQARYGNDGSATLGDDDCNWNVRFECNDSVGNNLTVHGDWEFGYVKITSLGGIGASSVNGEIAPENNGTSSDFVINWSSNWKYRVGVKMTSNLYHAGPPTDTITPNYVSVKEAHGYTPSYVPNDFGICPNDYQAFSGLNSYVYWYSGSGGTYTTNAPIVGNEQTFMTHFNVYVPLGTASGSYTALLTYVVDIE